MPLTPQWYERYRRNLDIPGFGERGQRQLEAARVLVVGAGGLGSAVLPYLTAAGIGHIGVVDGDTVELINLQRQVLHVEPELGVNKAVNACTRLRQGNSNVTLTAFAEYVDFDRATELFADYDLILDCCDSFSSKFVVSDAAHRADKPLVWAAAVGMQGQCSVFGVPDRNGNKLWLRDLIPVEPEIYPRATEVGVLGAMVGQVGTLQATEAIKLLSGIGRPLVGRVQVLDALDGVWRTVPLRKKGGQIP